MISLNSANLGFTSWPAFYVNRNLMKKCRYKRACVADQFALQQCFVVLNMAFCISSWLFICPVACAVVGFKDPDVEEV